MRPTTPSSRCCGCRDLLALLRKNYRASGNALSSFLARCAQDQPGCSGSGGDDPRAAFDAQGLAPTFAPALVSGPPGYDGANGAACARWPTQDEGSDREDGSRAQGAAPVLVVGATEDPSTPCPGAVTLAATLDDAALLTRVGQGHTSDGDSQCVRDAVDACLVDLTVPTAGVDDRCTDPTPAEILAAQAG